MSAKGFRSAAADVARWPGSDMETLDLGEWFIDLSSIFLGLFLGGEAKEMIGADRELGAS